MRHKWIYLLFGLFFMGTLASCEKNQFETVDNSGGGGDNGGGGGEVPEGDIIEGHSIASILENDSAQFTDLTAMLRNLNIMAFMRSEGEYTFFAPTNSAIDRLENELSLSHWSQLPRRYPGITMRTILDYHWVNRVYYPEDLNTRYYETRADNPNGFPLSLFIDADKIVAPEINARAMIQTSDTLPENGVIHIINHVLLPPSVYDLINANPQLSDFGDLFDQSSSAMDSIVSVPVKQYTAFVPDNNAFQRMYNTHPNISDLQSLRNSIGGGLEQTLRYHFLNENFTESQFRAGGINTMAFDAQGGKLPVTMRRSGGDFDLRDRNSSSPDASFRYTDVHAFNGTLHVIDEVLLPE